MSTDVVRRLGPAVFAGSRSWMIISLVGLLLWALVAHAVPPSGDDPVETEPVIPFRLTAAQPALAEKSRPTQFHVASFNILP